MSISLFPASTDKLPSDVSATTAAGTAALFSFLVGFSVMGPSGVELPRPTLPGVVGDRFCVLPLDVYTLRLLIVQYADSKAEGLFFTYSWQLAALEEQVLSWDQTLPVRRV